MYACYYLHIWSNYVSINNVLKSQILWGVKTTKLPRMTSIWFVSSEVSERILISPSTFIYNKSAFFYISFYFVSEIWEDDYFHSYPGSMSSTSSLANNDHMTEWAFVILIFRGFLKLRFRITLWDFSLPLHNIRPMPCWIYDASMQIFNLHKYIW